MRARESSCASGYRRRDFWGCFAAMSDLQLCFEHIGVMLRT